MTLLVSVRVAGGLLLALAVLNLFLPRRLGWGRELQNVSLLTRQVFFVHAGFIIGMVAMMGVLALAFAEPLLAPSPLARVVLAGLALFWLARLVCQWFVYDASLWRGKPLETAAHWCFTALWCYLTAVFGWAWWSMA